MRKEYLMKAVKNLLKTIIVLSFVYTSLLTYIVWKDYRVQKKHNDIMSGIMKELNSGILPNMILQETNNADWKVELLKAKAKAKTISKNSLQGESK